ncbi:MAG: threonine/serine exporter family protein [Sedimentibacter sp.]
MIVKFILEMIYCFIASLFFALIMNAPKKTLLITSLTASLGYLVYILCTEQGFIKLGFFLGTTIIAFMGEIYARKFKMPATIFIFPGVIPIVPGLGLYQTILAFVQDNVFSALEIGVNTILNIGAMAIAMALVSLIAMQISLRKTE